MRRGQGPAFATTSLISRTSCCERGPQALDGLLRLAEIAARFDAQDAAATAGNSSTGSPHQTTRCSAVAAGPPACSLAQTSLGQGVTANGPADVRSTAATACVPLQQIDQLKSMNPAQQQSTVSASSPRRQDGAFGIYPAAFGARNAHHSFLASSLTAATAAPHQPRDAPAAAGCAPTQSPRPARVATSAADAGPSQTLDTNLLADVISKMEPGNAAVVLAALGTWSGNALGAAAAPPAATAVQHSPNAGVKSGPATAAGYDTDDEASDSAGTAGGTIPGRPQRWSKEEHAQLEALVGQYGTKSWSAVAGHLPGRTGKQCRERYINHKAKLKKGNWSLQEEVIIAQLHSKWGNKWAAIARQLPGRSDNCLKNHWNTIIRSKRSSFDNNPRLSVLWKYSSGLRHGLQPEEACRSAIAALPESVQATLGSANGIQGTASVANMAGRSEFNGPQELARGSRTQQQLACGPRCTTAATEPTAARAAAVVDMEDVQTAAVGAAAVSSRTQQQHQASTSPAPAASSSVAGDAAALVAQAPAALQAPVAAPPGPAPAGAAPRESSKGSLAAAASLIVAAIAQAARQRPGRATHPERTAAAAMRSTHTSGQAPARSLPSSADGAPAGAAADGTWRAPTVLVSQGSDAATTAGMMQASGSATFQTSGQQHLPQRFPQSWLLGHQHQQQAHQEVHQSQLGTGTASRPPTQPQPAAVYRDPQQSTAVVPLNRTVVRQQQHTSLQPQLLHTPHDEQLAALMKTEPQQQQQRSVLQRLQQRLPCKQAAMQHVAAGPVVQPMTSSAAGDQLHNTNHQPELVEISQQHQQGYGDMKHAASHQRQSPSDVALPANTHDAIQTLPELPAAAVTAATRTGPGTQHMSSGAGYATRGAVNDLSGALQVSQQTQQAWHQHTDVCTGHLPADHDPLDTFAAGTLTCASLAADQKQVATRESKQQSIQRQQSCQQSAGAAAGMDHWQQRSAGVLVAAGRVPHMADTPQAQLWTYPSDMAGDTSSTAAAAQADMPGPAAPAGDAAAQGPAVPPSKPTAGGLAHLDAAKLASTREGLNLLESLRAWQLLPADVLLGPGAQLTVQLQVQGHTHTAAATSAPTRLEAAAERSPETAAAAVAHNTAASAAADEACACAGGASCHACKQAVGSPASEVVGHFVPAAQSLQHTEVQSTSAAAAPTSTAKLKSFAARGVAQQESNDYCVGSKRPISAVLHDDALAAAITAAKRVLHAPSAWGDKHAVVS